MSGLASFCWHSHDHASLLCSLSSHIRRFRCLDAVSCCQNRIESYAKFASFVGHSPGPYCNRLYVLQSLLVLTRLDYELRNSYQSAMSATRQTTICHAVCSLPWMQLLDWISLSRSTIMSLRFCVIFTNCVHCRESDTVWRFWCFVVNIEWLHCTRHRSFGMRLTFFLDGHLRSSMTALAVH